MHKVRIALMSCLAALACARPQPDAPRATPPASPQGEPASMRAGREAFERQDWAGAAAAYQKALDEGFNSPLVHFRLGFALHVTGEVARALPHHIKAAHIAQPALRIDALYNIACAHALLGDPDKALASLQRAIDAGFVDKAQILNDSDLDSLRAEPEWMRLTESIGVGPRLFEQLDGLLGAWTPESPDTPGASTLEFTRHTAGASPIVCVSRKADGAGFTSLLMPDPVERRWTWTGGDGIGTLQMLSGEAGEGGLVLEGRTHCASGPGMFLRRTILLEAPERLRDRIEMSEDGEAWIEYRSSVMVRRAGPHPAAPETAPKKPE